MYVVDVFCVHRISDEMENISILNKFPILLQCSRGLQFTLELQTKVPEDYAKISQSIHYAKEVTSDNPR